MRRLHSSMILLGICVAALVIGALRLLTDRVTLPTGSSYSAQPDGAMALFDWAAAVGGTPSRIQGPVLDQQTLRASTTLLVLQPESLIDATVGRTFDAAISKGGTLVVAGDSVAWMLYARRLGITVEPIRDGGLTATTPDSALSVSASYRYRLRADGATPLLLVPTGDWVALRMPYKQGTLIVLATPTPLTNSALGVEATARFVYREVLSGASNNGALIFDEAHHSFAPVAADPASLDHLLLVTAPGRALVYTAVLVFLYLLLSGRRLGPPIPARTPMETHRTMYEHVRMLANLYRRARQLGTVRAAFDQHYHRELVRGAGGSPKRAAVLAEALARIETAHTEAELIAAVASASVTDQDTVEAGR